MTTDPTTGPGHPHRPTCPPQERRIKRYRGKYGDLMQVCGGCGLVAQVSDPLTTPTPSPDGRGAAERAGARYVCRMHPAEAVTWRGKEVSRWFYRLAPGIDPHALDPSQACKSVPEKSVHPPYPLNGGAGSESPLHPPTDFSGTDPEPARPGHSGTSPCPVSSHAPRLIGDRWTCPDCDKQTTHQEATA